MKDSADILVDHFRQAVTQTERYLRYGLMSGLFAMLIPAGAFVSKDGAVNVPTLGSLDELSAMTVISVSFFAFGLLANSSLSQVNLIIGKLREEPVDLEILTTCPSVITIGNKALRVIALLMPAMLMLGSLIAEKMQNPAIELNALGALVVLVLPYLALALRLTKPLHHTE